MTLHELSQWELARMEAKELGLFVCIDSSGDDTGKCVLLVIDPGDRDVDAPQFDSVVEVLAYLDGYSDAIANFKAGRVPESIK